MYLPSIVPTIHFVYFFVPFASALLKIVVRFSSVSNAKQAFLGFLCGRHSGGFVMLSCSFSIVSTQRTISSSVISLSVKVAKNIKIKIWENCRVVHV